MKTCKVENCNNPIWSKGVCKNHTPRKPLKAVYNLPPDERGVKQHILMVELFTEIWSKRPHYSELSNTFLGNEPLSIFFHHILPKDKYPDAAFDEENIILLTLDEHTNVESRPQRYEIINEKRNYLKTKYNL